MDINLDNYNKKSTSFTLNKIKFVATLYSEKETDRSSVLSIKYNDLEMLIPFHLDDELLAFEIEDIRVDLEAELEKAIEKEDYLEAERIKKLLNKK